MGSRDSPQPSLRSGSLLESPMGVVGVVGGKAQGSPSPGPTPVNQRKMSTTPGLARDGSLYRVFKSSSMAGQAPSQFTTPQKRSSQFGGAIQRTPRNLSKGGEAAVGMTPSPRMTRNMSKRLSTMVEGSVFDTSTSRRTSNAVERRTSSAVERRKSNLDRRTSNGPGFNGTAFERRISGLFERRTSGIPQTGHRPSMYGRRASSMQYEMWKITQSKTHELINENAERRKQLQKAALMKAPANRTQEELETLDTFLNKVAFFYNLDRDTRLGVLKAVVYQVAEPGTVLCREGDLGDTFYIILEGSASVRIFDKQAEAEVSVAYVKAGQSFGELALREENSRRQATVMTISKVEMLTLQRDDYNSILREQALRETAAKVAFLKSVRETAFSRLPDEALEALSNVLILRSFPKGSVIVPQGSQIDELFFLKLGEVRLIREAALKGKVVSMMAKMASNSPQAFREMTKSSSTFVRKAAEENRRKHKNEDPLLSTMIDKNNERFAHTSLRNYNRPSTTAHPTRSGRMSGSLNHNGSSRSSSSTFFNDGRPATVTGVMTERMMRTFLEIGILGPYDIFGDVSPGKNTKFGYSVVTSCHVEAYVVNKWDFQRRLQQRGLGEELSKIMSRGFGPDKDTVDCTEDELEHTMQWMSYRTNLVSDVLEDAKKKTFLPGRS